MYASTSGTNFAELLAIAKQNADAAKKKTAHLNTDNKRRADPKQVKLKDGVAKFLAKRDEEDRRKKELEKLKREKLLQLRQQDRKATNRVRKMLSMTKSANKSCVEDAKDCLDASVAAQAQGDFQPDEDDYGYTSNYADMMHKKMMEKYKALPIKPAFPQTSNVPVPKHQSLSKSNGTGWRGRNGNCEEEGGGYSSPEAERYEDSSSRKLDKSKPAKKAPPPPPDYRLLLQMAQQKQFGTPVSLKQNKPINRKEDPEDFEFGRPMTAKEKKAFLEKKALEERVKRKFEGGSDGNNNSNNGSNSSPGKMPSFKIPKARGNEDYGPSSSSSSQIPAKKPKLAEVERKSAKEVTRPSSRPASELNGHATRPNPSSKVNGLGSKQGHSNGSVPPRPEKFQKGSSSSMPPPPSNPPPRLKQDRNRTQAPPQPKPDPRQEKVIQQRKELIKEKPRYLCAFEGKEPPKRQPPAEPSRRPREDSRERPKVRPGIDERPRMKGREEMGPPQRREMGEPSRRPMPMKGNPSRMRGPSPPRMRGPPPSKQYRGRAVIDSDDEYDSEMDDFIDDSEVDMSEISAEIGKLFNYDKRRFQYEDSDDDIMESSAAEQLLEEQRTLRIGIREDREEELRDLEEKRRLAQKKKRR